MSGEKVESQTSKYSVYSYRCVCVCFLSYASTISSHKLTGNVKYDFRMKVKFSVLGDPSASLSPPSLRFCMKPHLCPAYHVFSWSVLELEMLKPWGIRSHVPVSISSMQCTLFVACNLLLSRHVWLTGRTVDSPLSLCSLGSSKPPRSCSSMRSLQPHPGGSVCGIGEHGGSSCLSPKMIPSSSPL